MLRPLLLFSRYRLIAQTVLELTNMSASYCTKSNPLVLTDEPSLMHACWRVIVRSRVIVVLVRVKKVQWMDGATEPLVLVNVFFVQTERHPSSSNHHTPRNILILLNN